jgi:hypothetical protein
MKQETWRVTAPAADAFKLGFQFLTPKDATVTFSSLLTMTTQFDRIFHGSSTEVGSKLIDVANQKLHLTGSRSRISRGRERDGLEGGRDRRGYNIAQR